MILRRRSFNLAQEIRDAMRWGNKKQAKPLVAGRDRSLAQANPQAVYSYHSYRAKPNVPERGGQRISAGTQQKTAKRRGLLLLPSRQRAVYWICFALIALCSAKVLVVVPQSRVVVTDNGANLGLPVAKYAQSADTALQSSLLNAIKPTVHASGIARDLERRYPELSSVVVAVPLIGNRPVVYVSAERPAFALDTGTGLYSISTEGYVLARLDSLPSDLIRLKEVGSREPKPGSRFLPGSTVVFAKIVAYQLVQAGYTIDYLSLPVNAPYEMDLQITGQPYIVRYNLQADALQQSGGAIATLKKLGSNRPGQYLDVRVPGRAYYR